MSTAVSEGGDGTTHHLVHDWDGETPVSERIVAAVAEYEGEERGSLPGLRGSINPAALDALFEPDANGVVRAGCVTFSYYGYTVVVQSTGQVLLRRERSE